jgi:beta-glucosidase/6-phospho-beta-glucosidase/beta-galactosidase
VDEQERRPGPLGREREAGTEEVGVVERYTHEDGDDSRDTEVRMSLVLWLAACTPDAPPPGADPDAFPDGFRWGTATAGFQVEMGCPTWPASECEDRASDWYQWVTDPSISGDAGLYVTGQPVGDGPGMWELFESDVELMKADHTDVFRMSIEWSRIFPDAAAAEATTIEELQALAEPRAVARYHEMLAALEAAGIEPMVTANHYVLPLWLHDGVACHQDLATCTADGWVTADNILPRIALWSGWLAREYGGEVDLWMTLNEPFATTASGYLLPGEDRSSPPGLTMEVDGTLAVLFHQLEGHARMYDAIKAEDPDATVGLVMNFVDITPANPDNPADVQGAEHMDYLYHRLYLDAVTSGAWDDDLDGVPDRTRDDIGGRLDALGVNYYNGVSALGLPFPLAPEVPVFDFFPEFSWEPQEEGLRRVLGIAGGYGVPVWVTENGTPYVEDQGVEVLQNHVTAMHEAIREDGVDVRGYLYWSFVDNYEWNHGFDLRFGLYALDPVTKGRLPRAAAARFREYAGTNHL